jgi:hypothetical protein
MKNILLKILMLDTTPTRRVVITRMVLVTTGSFLLILSMTNYFTRPFAESPFFVGKLLLLLAWSRVAYDVWRYQKSVAPGE